MTYVRLAYTYYNQLDFQNAFTTAWETLKSFPDNQQVKNVLRDICLWAYYIHHNGLDQAYISTDMKEEYLVNSIDEEYLIIRNLRAGDETFIVGGQSLVNKNNASYDVLDCILSASKKPMVVNFKLNWDMNKYFGGIQGPAQQVITDKKSPIYERAGASLVANNKADLKTIIEGLQNQ